MSNSRLAGHLRNVFWKDRIMVKTPIILAPRIVSCRCYYAVKIVEPLEKGTLTNVVREGGSADQINSGDAKLYQYPLIACARKFNEIVIQIIAPILVNKLHRERHISSLSSCLTRNVSFSLDVRKGYFRQHNGGALQ